MKPPGRESNDEAAPTLGTKRMHAAWSAAVTRNNNGKQLQQEFLPAALEVQERPPSPTGRLLLWLLLSLFTIGLFWAGFGKVDIVVTAPGRIVPSGYVKIVQAPESAGVTTIHVTEGDRVVAGQALFTLDTTYAKADDTRIASQLAHAVMQLGWRRRFDTWLAESIRAAASAASARSDLEEHTSSQDTLFEQHRDEIVARMYGLALELKAARADQNALELEEKRSRATLAILADRVESYRILVERKYGARVQYLELLQQQTELEQSIPVMQARQQQTMESAAAIKARITSILNEARRENSIAITSLRSEIDSLQQESVKARQREQLLHITAPVTGTVQELALHTEGAVVTSAQTLLKIVPEDAPVEVEAMLVNRDVGFVYEGQKAEVKVDAFNFTKYGLLHATILNISDDAVQDEKLGWIFKMRLVLESSDILVDGKRIALTPGMAIATEIRTGERRLIEFFLSPLLRYQQESLRER